MKKRVLSLLLTLAMLLGLAPAMGMTVWAGQAATCPICGQEPDMCPGWWITTDTTHQRYCGFEMETGEEQPHSFNDDDKCADCGFTLSALYQGNKYGLKTAFETAENGGTIQLIHTVTDGDFTVTGKSLTLDENGQSGVNIKVGNGATIVLKNSAASADNGIHLTVKSGGKVTIADGLHSGNLDNYSKEGTFEITGGTFTKMGTDGYYVVAGAAISGGVFGSNANAIQNSTISGGFFQCNVIKSTISGGKFKNDPSAMTGSSVNTIAENCEVFAIAEGTADYTAGYRYQVYTPHIHDSVDFAPISDESDFNALLSNGGSGYLTRDITLAADRKLSMKDTVNLCLNGHTLDMNSGYFKNEGIEGNAALNIYDATGQGRIINGGNAYNAAFVIYDGFLSTCTMHDITIENCVSTDTMYGGGAICILGGSCTLEGVTIKNCSAVKGGAVYKDTGTLSLNNCTVQNNTATGCGGGMYIHDSNGVSMSGKVLIKDNTSGAAGAKKTDNFNFGSEFTGNPFKNLASGSSIGLTRSGGEGKVVSMSTSGVSCLFSDDKSYEVADDGMNIVLEEKSVCFIDADNDGMFAPGEKKYPAVQKAVTAIGESAGTVVMTADSAESVTVKAGQTVTLDLNGHVLSAKTSGSVITNNGTLTIKDSGSTAVHCFSLPGGNSKTGLWTWISKPTREQTEAAAAVDAIASTTTVVKILGGVITGGTGTQLNISAEDVINANGTYGGGVINRGTLTVSGGSIAGNSCSHGGGIANLGSTAKTDAVGCGFFGNMASKQGGGVYNVCGTFSANGVTLSCNTANSQGGGVYNGYYSGIKGTFTATNTTISGNTATDAGGGVYNNSGAVKVCGSTKITDNIRITGTAADNLCLADQHLTIVHVEGIDNAMEIGIYLSGKFGSRSGAFTTNGTAADTKYFTSDNPIYKVKFNNNGTEGTTDDYLELANYDLFAVVDNTVSVTTEKADMTEAQAIAIAKALKSSITKSTVIAYAKDTNFTTNSKYLVVTSSDGSTWTTGTAMTLAEMRADSAKDDFVIGTVTNHTHAWKYAKGGTGKENTLLAYCTADNCDGTAISAETAQTLTIAAPAYATYDGTAKAASVKDSKTSLGGITELPAIQYQKKTGETTYDTATTTAPTAAGTYKASITVDTDKTAYVEYTIAKAELTIVSAIVSDKTYDGSKTAEVTAVTFSGLKNSETLTKGTDYTISGEFNSADATGSNAATKVTVSVTQLNTTLANNYTVTATKDVDKTIGKAPQTKTAATPTVSSKTDTKIIINAVTVTGEAVEYAKSITNAAPESGWQDGTEFTGLTANTVYYIFARVKENGNYEAGAASTAIEAKTMDSVPASDIAAYAVPAKTGKCPQDSSCVYAKYTDTDTKAWYHDGIHFCVENGYMQGICATAFDPNGTLSRAMIVTMLWRMEGSPVLNYAMSFRDVAAGQWYMEAIRWAQSTGVVTGYDAASFGPNDNVTREQLAAILMRYAAFKGAVVSERADLGKFADAVTVSGWALESVKWANAVDLINGRTETTIAPTGNATRAEAASVVQRFCKTVLK